MIRIKNNLNQHFEIRRMSIHISTADQLSDVEQVLYPLGATYKINKMGCLSLAHSFVMTPRCDSASIKHQPPQ